MDPQLTARVLEAPTAATGISPAAGGAINSTAVGAHVAEAVFVLQRPAKSSSAAARNCAAARRRYDGNDQEKGRVIWSEGEEVMLLWEDGSGGGGGGGNAKLRRTWLRSRNRKVKSDARIWQEVQPMRCRGSGI